MDTLEKPVVDESIDLEFNDATEEQCTHSEHGNHWAHEGPAAFWQESLCQECGKSGRGYRCAKFVKVVMRMSGMKCGSCSTSLVDYTFTPLTPTTH